MNIFHLKTKDRVWHFASLDEAARDDWIQAIDDKQMGEKRNRKSVVDQNRTSTIWRLKCKQNLIQITSDSTLPSMYEQQSCQSTFTYNNESQLTPPASYNTKSFCYSTSMSI